MYVRDVRPFSEWKMAAFRGCTYTEAYRSGYNEPDSKSGVPSLVPRVRISPPPPKAHYHHDFGLFLLPCNAAYVAGGSAGGLDSSPVSVPAVSWSASLPDAREVLSIQVMACADASFELNSKCA